MKGGNVGVFSLSTLRDVDVVVCARQGGDARLRKRGLLMMNAGDECCAAFARLLLRCCLEYGARALQSAKLGFSFKGNNTMLKKRRGRGCVEGWVAGARFLDPNGRR
jgi:hypothetical protein